MADHPGLRGLPSVDRLLRSPAVAPWLHAFRRDVIVTVIRQVLVGQRAEIVAGGGAADLASIEAEIGTRLANLTVSPYPVINATGVLLHTNLGRAPLSDAAVAAVVAASAASNLELNLKTGERGSRQSHVQAQFRALTGAEAVAVTSNNASAVLLALTALLAGKEVIVSRGQAVEIGGAFRIPAILQQSGARLVEVGTTNRTRLGDYREAITPETGAILHVHPSNFRVVGFTQDVSMASLAGVARAHGLLLLADNGSGALLDTAQFGLAHEPMPTEALAQGADLVMFSGDKLLGGPQAGIVLGRKEVVERMVRHPLARAVRPDKMALAALSATLLAYLRGDAVRTLPLWQMISQSIECLEMRVERLRLALSDHGIDIEMQAGESEIGGGSLPGSTLPTHLIVLPPHVSAARLRQSTPRVVGRTRQDRVLLDLRSVRPQDEERLTHAVIRAAQPPASKS